MFNRLIPAAAALLLASSLSAKNANARRPEATIRNLQAAVEGEANAAHRYQEFAERADQEGYTQVAKLFRAAAESERIHRRNHEAVLANLGASPPQVSLKAVKLRSTRENLRVPIEGEREEAMQIYPNYIQEAESEGVAAAALSFSYARDAEREHLDLFERALEQLGNNPAVDYYVQAETGNVESRAPATAVPVTAPAARKASGSTPGGEKNIMPRNQQDQPGD